MSHFSVRGEQSTSSEILALTNLAALATSGAGEFIRKTGATTFANATPGASGFATTALDNLASVAINTSLLLGTSDGGALGSTSKMWSDLFLASGAVINFNNGDVTITHSADTLTIAGGVVDFSSTPTRGGSAIYYAGGTDVAVADGGTGKSSWTQYLIPYADTTTSFSQIAIGSSGDVLTSNGAGSAPTFQTPTSAPTNFADNVFYIKDDGDAAKRIAFQASGITTANTRTITMIDADLTIVGLSNAQALTGKTYNGLTVSTTTGTLTMTNGKTLTVSNTGTLAGGDSFTLAIAASKTLTVSNSLTLAGTDSTTMTFPGASDTIGGLGTTQSWTGANTYNIARSIASASGAVLDDLNVAAATTTVTGTTQITTAKGFNKVSIYKPTITDGSAVTIDQASSLYIEAAPLAAGSVTLTNTYAFWIDAGTARLDGSVLFGTDISPQANDGAALGTTALQFSDLFVASGAVLNFANGDVTITHSSALLTISSAVSLGTSNKITVGTIELGAASDTTIARSGAGAITVEGVQVILSGAALGTPSSGTLTNCTGLPIAGLTASTSTALGVGSIELGHASDTTIARVSAGVVSIEGVNIVTVSSTDTLTNKTLTAPKFADTGYIADNNGNEQIKFSTTASAVNEFTVKNAATGGAPDLQATGGDTNIDIKLTPKGSGKVAPQASVNFGAKTAYFTETDNGNSSTADTIDWTVSNKQKSTLTGNCTFTFTAPPGPCSLILKLVQDGTGSRTVTWPAAVHWSGGTAPTLTTTASKVDIISFYYDGTTYFGTSTLNFTA